MNSIVASPTDQDLKDYLAKLGPDPNTWPNFYEIYTPRRAYGQGQKGVLVWGEDCTGIRHFDCVSYVNYCMWRLKRKSYSYEIRHWKDEGSGKGRNVWKSTITGATVYNLKARGAKPDLEDGDIVAGTLANSEHIGFVGSDGTVYQAQDTTTGVHGDGKYKDGAWDFLP